MAELKRIALYGGTFDPVHVGHLTVARRLLELFGLDEVLFIPAYVAPHKRNVNVSPAFHRHAMLALATQDEPRFRISTVELDAPERPYTVETLAGFLSSAGTTTRFFFVMGADSWTEITTWRDWERVLTMTDHIVVTRPGYELGRAHVPSTIGDRIVDVREAGREAVERALTSSAATHIYLTDAARVNVSATEIRRVVNAGNTAASLSALVASPVADYIRKYGLYREVHETGFTNAGTGRAH